MRDVELFKNKMEDTVSIGEISIPDEILEKWQGIVNILAELVDVPAALITKIEPPVIRVFGLISYLGVPILLPDGSVFGTICVMDTREKEYHANYVDLMLHFKDLVESHLYLLFQQSMLERKIVILKRMDAELQRYHDHLEELVAKRTKELAVANEQLMLEIDERKLTEKALQESEERFRSLVENSLTGISIYQNGRLVYQNPEHERAGLYLRMLEPKDRSE